MSEFGYPLYPVAPTNQQAVGSITGTTTLGAGAATYGKHFLITGAGGYTITLPALDAVNFPASSFSLFNNSSATCTVNAAGADSMFLLGSSFSSVSILPGERFLVQNMVSGWVVALESASRTTTAPQFDNTIRSASTAFVQRALGNLSGVTVVSAPGGYTLTAANAGQLLDLTNAFTGTVTLPLASTMSAGAAFTVYNGTSGGITLAASGSDVIWPTNGSVASVTISAGDTVTISCLGPASAAWITNGGAGTLSYSKQFGASVAAAGYQKLPSGLIIQWGTTGSIAQGSFLVVTFPLAFPVGALLNPTLSPVTSGNNTNVYSVGSLNATATGFTATNNSGSSGAVTCTYIAIGR